MVVSPSSSFHFYSICKHKIHHPQWNDGFLYVKFFNHEITKLFSLNLAIHRTTRNNKPVGAHCSDASYCSVSKKGTFYRNIKEKQKINIFDWGSGNNADFLFFLSCCLDIKAVFPETTLCLATLIISPTNIFTYQTQRLLFFDQNFTMIILSF